MKADKPSEWGPLEIDRWTPNRDCVAHIVEHPVFDAFIGVVIFLNAINIGVEQSLTINGQGTVVTTVLESIFLTIYILELGARVYAKGLACFRDRWVKFDLFLCIMGVLTSWILLPVIESTPQLLNPLLVLRTTRLMRLGKTLRLFVKVQDCWMLIRGFMNSASIIFYAFIVWFLTLYVFSCVGVELITHHSLTESDKEFAAQVDKYFGNLPKTMMTLVRFACLDNTGDVYQPLVDKDPALAVYFVALILIVSVVLFHTLGAVIFSIMLDQNANEHEAAKAAKQGEWERLVLDLREMFERLDADRSGCLSRMEVCSINEEDQAILFEALGLNTPMQVFDALDVDNSGEVSISEFFDGVWECVLANGSIHLKRMEKQVETVHWRLREMFSAQQVLSSRVRRIYDELAVTKDIVMDTKKDISRLAESITASTPPAPPKSSTVAPKRSPEAKPSMTRLESSKESSGSTRGTAPRPARGRSRDSKEPAGRSESPPSPPAQRISITSITSHDALVVKLQRIVDDALLPALASMRAVAAERSEAQSVGQAMSRLLSPASECLSESLAQTVTRRTSPAAEVGATKARAQPTASPQPKSAARLRVELTASSGQLAPAAAACAGQEADGDGTLRSSAAAGASAAAAAGSEMLDGPGSAGAVSAGGGGRPRAGVRVNV